MQELKIQRTVQKKVYSFSLTDSELEGAYRIMERRYLEEDFINALADAFQNPSIRFHLGHLEAFPELLSWLCKRFDDFFDANMSHNDLIELTLDHLENALPTSAFFYGLVKYTPAICEGIERFVRECEVTCEKYYRCSNIAQADDRCKQLEALGLLLSSHQSGRCTCSNDIKNQQPCSGARYLSGEWDLIEFFQSEDRKEVV